MDLKKFFDRERIDVFATVNVSNLPGVDRTDVLHMFPAAQSVIMFGKEVPLPVYQMQPKEKTKMMLHIAESLDASAARLAQLLNDENIPSCPAPLYLPVKIRDGRVQGIIRLKHIAAAGGLGSIGKSSLLLSPRYGPRLLLSGVVTSRHFPQPGPADTAKTPESRLCKGCGRCIQVCPQGAFGPGGVDAFRCQTVRKWVVPSMVPAVKWMIGRTLLLRCAAPLAPWIARLATIRCSRCVTECPQCSGSDGKE